MLKKVMLMMMVALLLPVSYAWGAKKITIKTVPENAAIFIDGQEVGEGSYTVKFDKENEFYMVKAKAPGYVEKRIRVSKMNPKNTIMLRLPEDEAFKASTGSADGEDLGNAWMDITCRKGLTEDQVWKRLMSVATRYFSNIEVRDKTAGWIKTRWKVTKFTNQWVRTRLEVRIQFIDDETLAFRARIQSEIKNDLDCDGPDCYEAYDRVLKIYEPMIEELQTSVGGGE